MFDCGPMVVESVTGITERARSASNVSQAWTSSPSSSSPWSRPRSCWPRCLARNLAGVFSGRIKTSAPAGYRHARGAWTASGAVVSQSSAPSSRSARRRMEVVVVSQAASRIRGSRAARRSISSARSLLIPSAQPERTYGRALRLGPARVLDRGQRLQPRRKNQCSAAPDRVAEPHPGALARKCLLAQSDRDLLLDRAAQSTDPEDFHNLDELAARITAFQAAWQQRARPIDWRYTRRDLNDLLDRLNERHHLPAAA
jgi:hypothetical protein